MEVIIFRHGIAEAADGGQGDFDRALTAQGVTRTLRAAQGLARVAGRPAALLTSPKVRAMQTAAILGDVLDLAPERLQVLADGGPGQILDALRQRNEDSVLLVGHEPTLSMLAELLCTGQMTRGFLELKKAGAICIEARIRRDDLPEGPVLHWAVPPRVLRSLA